MAAELKAANPAINIEVLGINQFGQDASNPLVTGSTTLPWLQQDGTIPTVANRWGAFHSLREIHILDPRNRQFAVFSAADNDLSIPANYAALKQLFLNAAQFTDTDSDGLLDDWEMLQLGNLSSSGTDDPDGDGQSNAFEFAFGTKPNDSTSKTSFQASFIGSGAQRKFSVTFKRRAGSRFGYSLDASTALSGWSSSGVVTVQSFQQLFDGSGTGTTTLTIPAPDGTAQSFVRVRALQQ